MFAPGDIVHVVGISKGKGFQGVVKRHHFRGGAATHGSMFHRAPGLHRRLGLPVARPQGHARRPATWARTGSPSRNLKVVRVDAENNILVVKGAVPGAGGGYLVIRKEEGIGQWPRRRRRRAAAKAAASAPEARRTPIARAPTPPKRAAPPAARLSPKARGIGGRSNAENKKVSDVVLHPDVFGVRVNEHLLYEAVKQYRAGARARHARDQEPRPRLAARARSPGGRRAPAAPASARSAPRCGATAAPCSVPSPATTPTRHAEEGARGRPALRPQPAREGRRRSRSSTASTSTQPKTKELKAHPRPAGRRRARRWSWTTSRPTPGPLRPQHPRA